MATSPYSNNSKLVMLVGIVAFIIGSIGFGVLAGFWAIWYWIEGSIPKVWGLSRFWIDSFSAAIFAIIIVTYHILFVDEFRDRFRVQKHESPCIFDLMFKEPFTFTIGIFIVISLVSSIFISLAGGLAMFFSLWAVAWIARRAWQWCQLVGLSIRESKAQFLGADDPEDE